MMLPLVVALASAPDTAAAPAPAPAKLEEIGRVRALPACTPIVVRANSAIDDALGNDSTIAVLLTRLRNVDYDAQNTIVQKRTRAELMDVAKKIREAASAGDADVKKLRDMAAASPDPDRKAELKAFADALGGALFRQKRLAVDLDRAVTVHEGRVAAQGTVFGQWSLRMGPNGVNTDTPMIRPLDVGPTANDIPFNPVLRDVADNFSERLTLIAIDEGIAAEHALGATTGC